MALQDITGRADGNARRGATAGARGRNVRGGPGCDVRATEADAACPLIGREAEALAERRAVRERLAGQAGKMLAWHRRLLDYQCGDVPEEQLLAAAGASRLKQCEAHFTSAFRRLAHGDRAGARAHFEAAVATGVFVYFEHAWSRAFLARMQADPRWPAWLPADPPAATGG